MEKHRCLSGPELIEGVKDWKESVCVCEIALSSPSEINKVFQN